MYSIGPEGWTLFYYEAYEKEFDEEKREWLPFYPEQSFSTDVVVPKNKYLEGYDVVSFSSGTFPECSPLSCNRMSETIPVNNHCLLSSFEEGKKHLENGLFDGIHCEAGPYRIFAVYSV